MRNAHEGRLLGRLSNRCNDVSAENDQTGEEKIEYEGNTCANAVTD